MIPGTVCCLLCRGMVIYKDGDKSRFKNHMNNEHGAFFDIDYLLASCLLESEQKEAVAKTVKAADYTNLLKETTASVTTNTTRGEEATFVRQEDEFVDRLVLKKERIDVPDGNLQCACGTQFGTQEGFIQHSRKGCKKEEPKKKSNECDQCGKCYTSKQSLRAHKEKHHNMENIKQERYDDPSMDPSHLYPRFPEESEMVTNNEDIGYGVGDYQGNISSMQTDDAPTNEVFESNNSPVEQELDLLLSEVRKRNEDVLQDFAEESINNEEHSKAETSDSDRFVCEVEGCGKSYTIKSNMKIHMKKAHNIISTRAKNKKPKVSMEPPRDIDIEGQEKESNLRWDELEKIRAQYYNNTAEASSMSVDGSNFENGYQPKVDEIHSASLSTNADTGFDDDKDVEQTTNQALDVTSETNEELTPSLVAGLDMSQSKYFTRNPKVITSARGKSVSLFNELPVGLSENWKMRTFEVTTKTGDKTMIKHYLTPELKVLKTGLAVVEYLRLKGEMGTEQLLEISRILNIPEKKLKTLYD